MHRLCFILTAFFLLCTSCSLFDGSIYDTYQVPGDMLESIEPLDLHAVEKRESGEESPDGGEEKTPEQPPAAPEKLSLTLEECRAAALRNNLDLGVALLRPLLSEEDLAQAKAAFEPLFFSSFQFAKTDTPTFLTLDANQSEIYNASGGFRVPLHTGGDVSIQFPFNRTTTDNRFSTLDTSFTTDYSVSLNQPILRGGGFRAATHPIRLQRYNVQQSMVQAKLEVIRVLAAVDRVFWRLYAARRELEVRKKEYDLALEQLESAKRKLKVKQVAEIEVLRAREAAAGRLEQVIIAENQVCDRERELKLVLNKPEIGMDSRTVLVPEAVPVPVRYLLDETLLIEYALSHRMELIELELELAKNASTVDYMRNGTLPLLSVNYTYNVNALGETFEDSYDLMSRHEFIDHSVGAVLQVPLGNSAARSRLRGALLQKQLTLQTRKRRELLIRQDVLNAADQVQANWQRVVAAQKSTELAQRTLAEEKNRFELGLQTSIEVLNSQTRYADALSAQHTALVEYQIALIDLAYASGSLLGAARVEWDLHENAPR